MEAQLLRDCITAVCRVLMTHKDELDNLCQGTGVELGTEMYRFAEGGSHIQTYVYIYMIYL